MHGARQGRGGPATSSRAPVADCAVVVQVGAFRSEDLAGAGSTGGPPCRSPMDRAAGARTGAPGFWATLIAQLAGGSAKLDQDSAQAHKGLPSARNAEASRAGSRRRPTHGVWAWLCGSIDDRAECSEATPRRRFISSAGGWRFPFALLTKHQRMRRGADAEKRPYPRRSEVESRRGFRWRSTNPTHRSVGRL